MSNLCKIHCYPRISRWWGTLAFCITVGLTILWQTSICRGRRLPGRGRGPRTTRTMCCNNRENQIKWSPLCQYQAVTIHVNAHVNSKHATYYINCDFPGAGWKFTIVGSVSFHNLNNLNSRMKSRKFVSRLSSSVVTWLELQDLAPLSVEPVLSSSCSSPT